MLIVIILSLIIPISTGDSDSSGKNPQFCMDNPDFCRSDSDAVETPINSNKNIESNVEPWDLQINGKIENIKYDPDVIRIPQGFLRGQLMYSRKSRKYYSFMRIPYVTPPRRFEMALPPLPWKGIRDATQKSELCPQVRPGFPGIVVGNEDCLYLTVHVPEHILRRPPSAAPAPVIVFIHGGDFHYGGGDEYGARYFMDQDLILVTFNYRLGALGFFTTGDGEILGNMGLKDMIMALQWVKNNIGFFGGNPAMVTVMGQNAGAAAISLLMVSPMAKGLFSKAILQSGSALSPWALTQNPVDKARRFAGKLNCNGTSTMELAHCLRSKDVLSLVLAREEMLEWQMDPIGILAATVEVPMKVTGEPVPPGIIFLSEHPLKKLIEGRFHKVPVLMGINKDEGLLRHAQMISESPKLLQELNDDWDRIAPITLQYSNLALPTDQMNKISQRIRQFYFGSQQISSDMLNSLSELYGDRIIVYGCHTLMQLLAKFVPVFPYHFSFMGNHSANSMFGMQNIKGVTHMDELLYFFDLTFLRNIDPGRETEFSEKLVQLWASFAFSGKPQEGIVSSSQWLPISPAEAFSNNLKILYDLNDESKPIVSPFTDRMKFWDWLLQQELQDETRFIQYRQRQR